jgi:hypothetical protein
MVRIATKNGRIHLGASIKLQTLRNSHFATGPFNKRRILIVDKQNPPFTECYMISRGGMVINPLGSIKNGFSSRGGSGRFACTSSSCNCDSNYGKTCHYGKKESIEESGRYVLD